MRTWAHVCVHVFASMVMCALCVTELSQLSLCRQHLFLEPSLRM